MGAPVTVRLRGAHLDVEPPSRSFEWNGRKNLVSFVVTVQSDAPATRTHLCFETFIEGVPVSCVPLTLDIGDGTASMQPVTLTTRPLSSAFASYASQDAHLVALCLSALKHWDPQVDVFMDCLDLTPNEDWKKELARIIPAKEAFLLFWSVNARKSSWVAWELEVAESARGLGCVLPMPLEDPAIAPPPEKLKHLHFRDRYLMARETLMKSGQSRE